MGARLTWGCEDDNGVALRACSHSQAAHHLTRRSLHALSFLRATRCLGLCCDYSDNVRNRKAFPITDTELNVIAAAASIGLSKMPKTGYSTPAAIGTPRAL